MTRVKNITEGPIISTILRLAWPVLTSMLLEFALSVTDFFWVGRLGTVEQDAIVSSMIVTWTYFSVISIIVIGLTALISRAIGADDEEKASFVFRQGIQTAAVVGAVFVIAGFILTPSILRFMKTSPAVMGYGISYLRILFSAIFLFFFSDAFGAAFRATGDTKSPTIAMASGTVLNIVLDPALIFGIGPIPAMGVSGAALGTVISSILSLAIFLIMIYKNRLGFPLTGIFKIRPHFETIGKIFKIGLPISMQNLAFNCVYWFLIQIVHHYGDAAGAAMGVGNRMEALSFLTAFGFSTAASTMVGQNLGAKKPERAAKCAYGSLYIVMVETFIISIFFITIPGTIARVFSSDPAVIAIAIDYLIILGLSQLFMGIEIVLEGAFSGAGDTVPPMIISITGSVLRLPIAYVLCFVLDVGINGVWWSLTITSVLKAVVIAWWFSRGRWKTKEI
jgi:putative MATE family efflux protein